MLDVPLLYSPKISISDLDQPLKTILAKGVDRQLAKREFLTSPIYKDMLLSADGKTTGLIATLSLDQHYLSLVTQRDNLRLLRDTEGLSLQENHESSKPSVLSFLIIAPRKPLKIICEWQRCASLWINIATAPHLSRRPRYDYCGYDRFY